MQLRFVRVWHWVGILGALLTGLGAWQLHFHNQRRLEAELERSAVAVAQEVQLRFGLYEYGLRGARGAVIAGGGAAIRRETFAAYSQSRELSREFPGARGFGFIRRWPLEQQAELLRRARNDGMPEFWVRELAPNAGERFVIEYLYPQASNQGATGLDIASEPIRREAAIAAAREAAVQLTAPITLVQADKKVRQGFLMLLPVYADRASSLEPEGRLAATLGWTYAPLVADEVLKPLIDRFPLVRLRVGEVGDAQPFFSTHREAPGAEAPAAPRVGRQLAVFGRQWQIELEATEALRRQTELTPPWLVLALGAWISLLLALIVRLATASAPPDEAAPEAGDGPLAFLRSPVGRWTLLALLGIGAVYAALAWWQVRAAVAAKFEQELQQHAEQRRDTSNAAMKGRQTALIYLRGTPPVGGLIRSDGLDRDPLDGSTTRSWQQRMGQIFVAYGLANPDARDIRLLRLAGEPVNLVVWKRDDAGRQELLSDQPVAADSLRYLEDLRARLRQGQAWTHPLEVSLLPQADRHGEPLRQLIRYTLPVLDGGRLFAVLQMDIDISPRFTAKALQTPWGGSTHILSRDERWLSRQGPVEGDPGDRWQDRYEAMPLGVRTPMQSLRAWRGPVGEVLSAEAAVDPNPGDQTARIVQRVAVPMSAMQREIVAEWEDRFWPPVGLAVFLYVLVFLYWRLQRVHQLRLLDLNAGLTRRVGEQTRDLQEERGRLSNILEGTGAGTWEWNCQTGETRFNSRWAEILGYPLDALPPMTDTTWLALIHPDDLERTRALLKAHLKGDNPSYVCESRLWHREGHWIWTLSSGRVMTRTADGRAEWVSGTLLDITEMRAAQEERERFGHLLSGVLQAARDFSIIATGPDGLITLFNAGSERLLGYRADEMVGRQTPAILHLPEEVMQRGVELSAAEGRTIEGFRVFVDVPERLGTEQREWTYVRKDGSRVPVSLTVSVLRNGGGAVVGYLGIAQDVSERRANEQALRHAKVAAEAASDAKSMFLANMSHEIRTPMNAVIGIAHLLADSPLNPDQRQLLSKLQIAGRSLLGVINDVLDLAKIEAGDLATESAPYRPAALLQELDSMFGDQARAKGLSWSITTTVDLPETLLGDAKRLQQVLANLLSNAIKFTQQGGVSLRVECAVPSAPGGKPRIHFAVRDTGIGIEPEAQARLFQPFVQAEASTTRRFGGTGLGLSIVKHLSELMGGSVKLSSAPGQGSEFTVELPLLVGAVGTGNGSGGGFGSLEAIVVEDEAIQRERLAALCSSFGWRVQSFDTAEALLDLVRDRHAQHQRLPDVLLVDWQLGDGLDGISALRRLRGHLPSSGMPGALLITQDQRRALQAEDIAQVVDAVLAKPANPSALFNAVNEAIARRSGSSEHLLNKTAMARLGGGLLPGVRLLVVDDSEINLEVARRMLERQGAAVVCEPAAEAALQRLRQGEVYDAVLMDIQMPDMDGLQATHQIRQALQLDKLPVIALTAGALVEERRRAIEAGMDDFLSKPLDPETLVRTLRRHIEARRGAPLAVSASQAEAALQPDWPLIDGIETAEAAQRLSGDAALFCRLLSRLLETHDSAWLARLGKKSSAQAAAELHKLRGSAGLLGAQRVQDIAAEGEARLRDGVVVDGMQPLLATLEQALRALAAAAKPWLERPTETAEAPADTVPSADGPRALAELRTLLRQQDLDADKALAALRPWLLAQGISVQVFSQLTERVGELDFEAAMRLLEAHEPRDK